MAFDTLDIDTLIRRLQWTFGIDGSALDWIRSYLTDRSQFVRVGESESGKITCEFGVPQGSVLGPIYLFYFPNSSDHNSYLKQSSIHTAVVRKAHKGRALTTGL